MFDKSSRFYDAIYEWKDYAAESKKVDHLIQEYRPGARTLLDVACGTGLHLQHFATGYEVEGVDVNPELLAVARDRLPDVRLTEADMESMALGRTFDVVTCLFSSIGYVLNTERLDRTIAVMARHLNPGGVLIVEPWFTPEGFVQGHVGAVFVDKDDLKIARINDSRVHDGVSEMTLHYLIGSSEGVSYFTEEHSLGLFTEEQYLQAFSKTGLDATHDSEGLMGRGLYIGVLPAG